MIAEGYAPSVYMPLAFPLQQNFHYFPEAALEVWHYLHVPWVKREPKFTLIDFVEAAKALGNWVGIGLCSQLLRRYMV